MNNLSWFLYLAEVIPSVGMIAEVFSVVLGALIVGWWLAVAIEGCKTPVFWLYPLFVGLLLVAIATPSTRTIYLIAGSEAGEYVVTSPAGQEIIDDISTIIKNQLKAYTD